MNKTGAISRRGTNREWGSHARKEEDAQRGLNNRARREACAEQLADNEETIPFSWEDWFARDISGEFDNWYHLIDHPEAYEPEITAQEA